MEAFIFLVVAFALLFGLWRNEAPKAPKQDEDPCDTCTRWYVCNGVDEECPRKNNA